MQFTREQVEWLRTLLASHRELQRKLNECDERDEDPTATAEMYADVERLADVLNAQLDYHEAGPDAPPSDEEIDAMVRAAGHDEVPF